MLVQIFFWFLAQVNLKLKKNIENVRKNVFSWQKLSTRTNSF